ncbi:MAG: DUF362 domain-containing protein, partial [Candidatus Aminicenantes bacterium]|nr:DUF362 domain-containing protein [Candidatus Aminicenantes bacterium]
MISKPMTRREIVRILGTSALSALPAAAIAKGRQQRVTGPALGPLFQVALVPCPDYGPETLIAAIRAGWRSSRPPEVRGKRIVIKPNIADFAPDRPIQTDPRLVEALIIHLGDLGAREVILAEGPPHNRDTEML